jgi:hypothetical protein
MQRAKKRSKCSKCGIIKAKRLPLPPKLHFKNNDERFISKSPPYTALAAPRPAPGCPIRPEARAPE